MKKLIAALALSLSLPGIACASDDIWTENCWNTNPTHAGIDEPNNIAICFEKQKSHYNVEFIFDRMCGGELQYGRIRGIGKGNQREMSVGTKDGSNLILKVNRDKYEITVSPTISPRQKIVWDKSDKCKGETGTLSDKNILMLRSRPIYMLEFGLN